MATKLSKIAADFVTQLAATMAVGATSGTLQSVTDDDGNALSNGVYYFTIDGNNSNKEYIQATITGTAMASVKHVTRQGTLSAGTTLQHRAGATVEITDFAVIKMMLNLLDGTDDLDATNPIQYDAEPILTPGSNEIATVKYVDEVSIAGASNASTVLQGLVEAPTQAEVDAGTGTGGTGAKLFVSPDLVRGKAINDYAADSVGTDSYAITITPAITAYATGQVFIFKAGTANTGACTLNVSGLGAKTLKKNKDQDLVTGEILADQIVAVCYDGTNMQVISRLAGSPCSTQTFNADGTWTKPNNLKFVDVEVWGAGGGGGGKNGGGGGGGAYLTKRILAADLGATEAVTVGTGGTGGAGSGADGVAGGNSSFGSHLTAYGGGRGGGDTGGSGGGGGGASAVGGNASTTTAGAGGGPAGGAAGSSSVGGSGVFGGGGGGDGGAASGGAGGPSSYGGGGGGSSNNATAGGPSVYGGGGGGSGEGGSAGTSVFGGAGGAGGSGAATGGAGTAPGGGGGGGGSSSGVGGAGAAGRVKVTEYYY